MNKHEMREQVFKIIFGIGFHEGDDLQTLIDNYLDDSCEIELKDSERRKIAAKALAVGEKIPDLDRQINEVAEGWKTNRMGKAELNILRLALYEIKYDDSVPVKVAINEAVELSKEYCNDDTPGFINGMLANFV
ncbi:MAG: transcription antitermination factor NusB [Lachnospiraceae bacterium]|jgi:N utilization substance protein B|nr:transcription antitermination factor NusB [Lachnospiraceae bacterium]MBQ2041071.1 transcription antitermination factor NusB [Lachnospiraceae bacterium]